MKNFLSLLVVVLVGISFIDVKAANYELMELIPVNIHTSITTDHYAYKDFYYNDNQLEADALKNNFIIFGGIKNISDEERDVSISIGLFDEDKKNIGTINYCSSADNTSIVAGSKLAPGEEKSYVIEVNKKLLADKKSVKDIKYIAVFNENTNCNTGDALGNVGRSIDEVGMPKNNVLDSETTLLLKILGSLAVIGIIIFLYRFLFSGAFTNVDGEDVRAGYKYLNKKLERERELDRIQNPPKPKEVKQTKSDEVLAQEAAEKARERQDSSDLHNFYK